MNLNSLRQKLGNLDFVLILILILSGGALFYRLADPDNSLIFDETYYVQMARVLLGHPVYPEGLPGQDVQSGCDPNSEHPPLAKIIMAIGIYIFRDHALGWRLPSIALGLLGIACLYAIARQLGATKIQARWACFLLAFDNLYFVHSRVATLDIYMVSLALVGTLLYLKRYFEFAGLAFALSTVCKINGLLGVFALFLYELGQSWLHRRDKAARLPLGPPSPNDLGGAVQLPREPLRLPLGPPSWRGFFLTLVFYLPFAYTTLGAMDCYVTKFPGPAAHVIHIFRFGTSLSRPVGVSPQGAESTPLRWWSNEKNFDYLLLTKGDKEVSKTVVRFQGCMSIYFIALAPFGLIHAALEARKGNRLALLAFCLFVGNYVPMLVTWIKARRICYLFYMLPSMPAIALSFAVLASSLPGWVLVAGVAGTVYTFLVLFPFPIFTWV